MACPFCDIPQTEATRLVARNDLAYAARDSFAVTPGHTLVIPLRHVSSFFNATPSEQHAIWALVDEVRRALDAGPEPPDGYNIGINVGEAAGQTVMHLHVHVIPRHHGDVDDPRGGVRYVIEDTRFDEQRCHLMHVQVQIADHGKDISGAEEAL